MSTPTLRGVTMTARAFRRYISSTRSVSSGPLPFEKPIFESEVLANARAEKEFHRRLELAGDVLVIGVGLSLLGRMGYYVMYGKENGAGALPRRDRNRD